MRINGPLTATSAFDFENFYAELRRSFAPGTQNPLKQIFQSVLLKRILRTHSCHVPVYYSSKDTPLESNSVIYEYDNENNDHTFYKIKKILVSGQFLCCKIGKYPAVFDNVSLPWETVGVYRKGPLTSKEVILDPSETCGKGIIVGNLIITCPVNILEEK